ncbi:MAG: demethoxyubiquinone hydroxylase family protein [Rickettsiales bacterium]|nr:demethoxyubiquinone hydroxylase family protein [Pseudomonadota bacterium]MDA0966235.1 demethoxyubiquinone hydroxylase family protein [Pseudomonadota bacterium]MDG4543100.1 demethoxyubiquinone hydroxylase family protein [Rickettsiales bacterium]MDG4545298.1 demethoxyubiquinone hydroxylase family protein [Rickettsiales bacterium]MDG4547747.1 demethoxyubiquinone hydroxylase family protein [Rickettsiales bacterium]
MAKKNRLPGDIKDEQFVHEVIRVDHAGEYGAKMIYAGQMAVLKKSASYETIKHMARQEEEHLQYFENEISNRRVRPTVMMPVWHVGAFALGAATALMGEKAAMACTEAVEDVIEKHYQEQLDNLSDDEAELKKKIKKFRDEEIEHRDLGIANHAKEAPAYPLLRGAVSFMTKTAIAISKKV